jgi:hypothetical protein
MWRERALKVVLVLVGLVFSAAIYPVVTSVRDGWQANKEDALPMMLSLYVTLGIFLLLASAEPVGESQRDRFRRMVEFCSRVCDGCHGSPPCERTRSSADRRGCV